MCPKCAAGYRRIEITSVQGVKGEYRCLTCDDVLEEFDGSLEVLIRLTVPPQKTLQRPPIALGIGRVRGHIGKMKKSHRVTFVPRRIAEGDWQIEAHCPGTEIRYIKGLVSKADVDEWLAGQRKLAWLRSQGYAK